MLKTSFSADHYFINIQQPVSQHFIFFVTYEWTQQGRVLITLGFNALPRTNTIAY